MTTLAPNEERLTPQERIFKAVDEENLTWEYAGTQTRYKLYSSEYEYRTLTRAERAHLQRLLDAKVLKLTQGWRFGAGFVTRFTSPGRPRRAT